MKYTFHCLYCDKCIEGYDHHCYWINNCVGKNNLDLFFVFLFVIILNILVNVYLDVFCLVNKFDKNGHLITKFSRTDSLYNQSKYRFTPKNLFFFDIPSKGSDLNLSFDYETNANPEYFVSDELQGFFNLNRERSINKIKFSKQDKDVNSALVNSEN